MKFLTIRTTVLVALVSMLSSLSWGEPKVTKDDSRCKVSPTVRAVPELLIGSPGETRQLGVEVQNNNPTGCPETEYVLNLTSHKDDRIKTDFGWTLLFSPGRVKIAAGKKVVVPTSLGAKSVVPEGIYDLGFQAFNPSNTAEIGRCPLTYSVRGGKPTDKDKDDNKKDNDDKGKCGDDKNKEKDKDDKKLPPTPAPKPVPLPPVKCKPASPLITLSATSVPIDTKHPGTMKAVIKNMDGAECSKTPFGLKLMARGTYTGWINWAPTPFGSNAIAGFVTLAPGESATVINTFSVNSHGDVGEFKVGFMAIEEQNGKLNTNHMGEAPLTVVARK